LQQDYTYAALLALQIVYPFLIWQYLSRIKDLLLNLTNIWLRERIKNKLSERGKVEKKGTSAGCGSLRAAQGGEGEGEREN
jgi:hypothetical protein